MSTIVVATDGSKSARAALEVAFELAAEQDADVVCAHVVSALDFAREGEKKPVPPNRPPRTEDDPVVRDALAFAVERGVRAHAELLVGNPSTQIARLARELDAELIVVGSRGHGRVKSAVLGSTSRELVAHADRPVLVVRDAPAGDRASS